MKSISFLNIDVVDKLNTQDVCDEYHKFYYNNLIWDKLLYRGHKIWKSVSDLWLYQEILWELKPSLVIEFGSAFGGSALYFSDCLLRAGLRSKVVSCDIDLSDVPREIREKKEIEFVLGSSISADVMSVLKARVWEYPGKIFVILDSSHKKQHVLAEMLAMRELLKSGDYLVVEDSNIGGHPIGDTFGEGPWEAIKEYESIFPGDYRHDVNYECKFGWTFAPNGFLIRN